MAHESLVSGNLSWKWNRHTVLCSFRLSPNHSHPPPSPVLLLCCFPGCMPRSAHACSVDCPWADFSKSFLKSCGEAKQAKSCSKVAVFTQDLRTSLNALRDFCPCFTTIWPTCAKNGQDLHFLSRFRRKYQKVANKGPHSEKKCCGHNIKNVCSRTMSTVKATLSNFFQKNSQKLRRQVEKVTTKSCGTLKTKSAQP